MLRHADLNIILQNLAQSLDIPESYSERARDRYQAIGKWLGREGSIVSEHQPEIYPQGSFLLGTVIKPISDKDEYDIDLVCRLHFPKQEITQKRLKELLGSELVNYVSAHQMRHLPIERRRCWRLNYSDGAQFHLDVLPSIPEDFYKLNNEIAITDNQHPDYAHICSNWICCNPIDYAEWFKARMKVRLQEMKRELAESLNANIEDVPVYKIKTPLQQVVQILKRHRDMTFSGNQDDKPISILITTLAAQAYNNEADIVEALVNVVTNMPAFIEDRNGALWVENPVNPSENFADKWHEYPNRQELFLDWLTKAEIDVLEAVNSVDLQSATKSLKRQFGETAINRVMEKSVYELPSKENTKALANLQQVFLVPHRKTPSWEMRLDSGIRVEVAAKAERSGYRPKNYFSNGARLSKNVSIRFTATTNAKKPHDVYWQVVNTGNEAHEANQLRGGFYQSSNIFKGKRVRVESTRYNGSHWVECFIVDKDICIARSGEFVVNID